MATTPSGKNPAVTGNPRKTGTKTLNYAAVHRSLVKSLDLTERAPQVGGYHKLGNRWSPYSGTSRSLWCRAFHDTNRLGERLRNAPHGSSRHDFPLVVLCHYRATPPTLVMTDVYGELSSFLRLSYRLIPPPFTDILHVGVGATTAFSLRRA